MFLSGKHEIYFPGLISFFHSAKNMLHAFFGLCLSKFPHPPIRVLQRNNFFFAGQKFVCSKKLFIMQSLKLRDFFEIFRIFSFEGETGVA